MRATIAAVVVLVLGLSVSVPQAAAAHLTFQVNATADEPDASAGDGICATTAGQCTLRAAVQEANAHVGADTIRVPAGTYRLARSGTNEDAAATGDLDLTDDVTIVGAGTATTAVDGAGIDRLFDVPFRFGAPLTTVTINRLTLRNGFADVGGAVTNAGRLTLSEVTVLLNRAQFNTGGVFNHAGGQLVIRNSLVAENTAALTVGGISNSGRHPTSAAPSSVHIVDSVVSGNAHAGLHNVSADLRVERTVVRRNGGSGINSQRGPDGDGAVTVVDSIVTENGPAQFYGGGISSNDQRLTVINSTISRNSARDGGGGILHNGTSIAGLSLRIDRSTISDNAVTNPFAFASGLAHTAGDAEIVNSTISGNTGPNASAVSNGDFDTARLTVTNTTIVGGVSLSRGIVSVKNTLFARPAGSQRPNCVFVGVGAQLASLGHNLSSDTSCPLTGPGDLVGVDPKIGPLAANGGLTQTHALLAGSPAIDAGDNAGCPPTDQRGMPRLPLVSGTCDIGAYERRGR